MPSIAEAPFNERKRRRDDSATLRLSSQNKAFSPHNLPSHHTLLSPTPPAFFPPTTKDAPRHTDRRLATPKGRTIRGTQAKRQRIEPPFFPHEIMDVFLSSNESIQSRPPESATTAPLQGGKIDLSRCHICFRKPTIRSELDDYADCEECGRRTCFICMRACEGSGLGMGMVMAGCDSNELSFEFDEECGERMRDSGRDDNGSRAGQYPAILAQNGDRSCEKRILGHKGMICSRCCVEDGPDGDVWCLGCLKTGQAG